MPIKPASEKKKVLMATSAGSKRSFFRRGLGRGCWLYREISAGVLFFQNSPPSLSRQHRNVAAATLQCCPLHSLGSVYLRFHLPLVATINITTLQRTCEDIEANLDAPYPDGGGSQPHAEMGPFLMAVGEPAPWRRNRRASRRVQGELIDPTSFR